MNKKHVAALALVTVLGAFGGYALKAAAGTTQVATPLYYSGVLTEGGQLVAGTRSITVNFWPDGTTPGTPLCVTSAAATPISGGRFSVPLDPSCTAVCAQNAGIWVEVVDGTTSLGRMPVGAVPYAVSASYATTALSANTATSAALAWNAAGDGGIAAAIAALQSLLHPASGFRATLSTSTPISGTTTAIVFDTVSFDLAGEYSATTGQFVPNQAGTYIITCGIEYSSSTNENGGFRAVILGGASGTAELETTSIGGGVAITWPVRPEATAIVQLNAGDVVSCNEDENLGALTLDPSTDTEFAALRIY